MKNLARLSISYIDRFFLKNTKELVLTVIERGAELDITFKGIIYFGLSNDEGGEETGASVVEVKHEFRKVMFQDLENYEFLFNKSEFKIPLHIIKFYGDTILSVVCEKINIPVK